MTIHDPHFDFDNTYARELEGFYIPWEGAVAPAPVLLLVNQALAEDLGLDPATLDSDAAAAIFSGSRAPEGADPLAQAYAGHQFGGFSPQLGDGRALLLGEILDREGNRRDLQLKGSGRTPFSRGGDGKAVIGPVLREYIMGEAMAALGVPTTRALAAVTTGEEVDRDGPKPGAVLARIASSHLRVGTFQFFAARKDWDKVRQLADYAIQRHDPELVDDPDKYLKFLQNVADRQARLIAHWMQIGFVHGVMNTDNMAISGETIDYGPCAFIDHYDPAALFSSIDQGGRYAYGQQPVIAQWNLARLAETLLLLIDPDDSDNAVRLATNVINQFIPNYIRIWTEGMRQKIGLTSGEEGDTDLINEMYKAMEGQAVDHTRFFRALAEAAEGRAELVTALFKDATAITAWIKTWQDRCLRDPLSPADRAAQMNQVNPVYIPRNHLVEDALNAAQDGDLARVKALLSVLSAPFEMRPGHEDFEGPAPDDFGPYRTFCGT